MSLLSFNINHKISVKLTDEGKAIYLAYTQAMHDSMPEVARKNLRPVQLPPTDEEDFTQFTAWDFMHGFGPYLYLGGPGVCDMNIRINSDNIHPIERNI